MCWSQEPPKPPKKKRPLPTPPHKIRIFTTGSRIYVRVSTQVLPLFDNARWIIPNPVHLSFNQGEPLNSSVYFHVEQKPDEPESSDTEEGYAEPVAKWDQWNNPMGTLETGVIKAAEDHGDIDYFIPGPLVPGFLKGCPYLDGCGYDPENSDTKNQVGERNNGLGNKEGTTNKEAQKEGQEMENQGDVSTRVPCAARCTAKSSNLVPTGSKLHLTKTIRNQSPSYGHQQSYLSLKEKHIVKAGCVNSWGSFPTNRSTSSSITHQKSWRWALFLLQAWLWWVKILP